MQIPLQLLSYDAVQIFLLSILFLSVVWLARRSIQHGERLASIEKALSNDLHDIRDRLDDLEKVKCN
jgi:hypothetical protein